MYIFSIYVTGKLIYTDLQYIILQGRPLFQPYQPMQWNMGQVSCIIIRGDQLILPGEGVKDSNNIRRVDLEADPSKKCWFSP